MQVKLYSKSNRIRRRGETKTIQEIKKDHTDKDYDYDDNQKKYPYISFFEFTRLITS